MARRPQSCAIPERDGWEDKFLEFMDMDHEAAEGAARYSRKALTRQLVEELESLVRNNREI